MSMPLITSHLNFSLIALRRITTTSQFDSRFNHLPPKPFSVSNYNMSAQQPQNNNHLPKPNSTTPNIPKSEGTDQKPLPLPPPPEKPLPGDCCGSGCVRCVWDIYYEELEEYDRLYKPSGSKPS